MSESLLNMSEWERFHCSVKTGKAVMSFPYRCLATAAPDFLSWRPRWHLPADSSAPHLVLLTHQHTDSLCVWTLCPRRTKVPQRTFLLFLPHERHVPASSKAEELFPVCAATSVTHPSSSFRATFPQKFLKFFSSHSVCIFRALQRSVTVCLTWRFNRKREL